MAELNPPLGTTTPEIFLDNVKRADELVNGPAGTVNDRAGEPLDTWRQMMAKNDEVRQNLIPLSKQYQTLAAAQADIANIPVGSTTYYRSPDDNALAVEVINNAGTLQPTGRKMASYSFVEKLPTLGKSGVHPNLVNFDDVDLEDGRRLSVTTGLTEPLAGYNTTGWIPVTPGQQLVFSVLGEIVDFYSSSRAFLSGASQATRYVTVPA
ncbi:SGNH/GDSL hydrolase family protein, partial [Klebsiella sp. R81]